jgi:hypothetical protein
MQLPSSPPTAERAETAAFAPAFSKAWRTREAKRPLGDIFSSGELVVAFLATAGKHVENVENKTRRTTVHKGEVRMEGTPYMS